MKNDYFDDELLINITPEKPLSEATVRKFRPKTRRERIAAKKRLKSVIRSTVYRSR